MVTHPPGCCGHAGFGGRFDPEFASESGGDGGEGEPDRLGDITDGDGLAGCHEGWVIECRKKYNGVVRLELIGMWVVWILAVMKKILTLLLGVITGVGLGSVQAQIFYDTNDRSGVWSL